jgi:hypothetical protein
MVSVNVDVSHIGAMYVFGRRSQMCVGSCTKKNIDGIRRQPQEIPVRV